MVYFRQQCLSDERSEQRVSTGLDALDAVLGGLYWGDNVVWQLDAAPVAPFYSAIACLERRLRDEDLRLARTAPPTHSTSRAGGDRRRTRHAIWRSPADLLREIHRICHPRGRRLLLFESLDCMVRAWGASNTRGFFARCCPLLLEVGRDRLLVDERAGDAIDGARHGRGSDPVRAARR